MTRWVSPASCRPGLSMPLSQTCSQRRAFTAGLNHLTACDRQSDRHSPAPLARLFQGTVALLKAGGPARLAAW